MTPNYKDGSAPREHEVSTKIGQESQFGSIGLLPLVVVSLSGLDNTLQWLTDGAMIHRFYRGQDCTQECERAHFP